jgi:hypothetical protein
MEKPMQSHYTPIAAGGESPLGRPRYRWSYSELADRYWALEQEHQLLTRQAMAQSVLQLRRELNRRGIEKRTVEATIERLHTGIYHLVESLDEEDQRGMEADASVHELWWVWRRRQRGRARLERVSQGEGAGKAQKAADWILDRTEEDGHVAR